MRVSDVVRSCLEDILAAESAHGFELRSVSQQEDDDEVKALLAWEAEQSQHRCELLTSQIGQSGDGGSASHRAISPVSHTIEKLAQGIRLAEERTVQHLVTAYSIHSAACAAYEALSAVCANRGEKETGSLALQLRGQHEAAAHKAWRLIPSRSKIAFNLLTVGELDPAIVTKAAENRVR